MSLEQERQAEYEMQQLLSSIPTSKFMSRYDVVDKAIDSLEKTIKRLKAFVRFMSLLSPAKYIEWMKQAYAQYVPGKTAVTPKESIKPKATSKHYDDSNVKGEAVQNNTPEKRYLPTP